MDRQKHIWIVNYYSTPPAYVSNERHLKFAYYLQQAGYRVTIFSAGFMRKGPALVDEGQQFKQTTYDNTYRFVHVKVRPYVGNGLARMFSIFQFAWKVLRHRKQFERPDIILHNMHAPFDYPISTCAKRLGAKYVAEEWDLWPEYFVTFGLISAKNPLMRWAYGKERRMFQRADAIVFSFAGGLSYLQSKGWTKSTGGRIDEAKVHYINNGVALDEYQVNKDTCVVDDPDLVNPDLFKVVYLGSIRLVNDVKQVIDAMAQLRDYPNIKLLIYGNGDQREALMQYVADHHITNVEFKAERIPLSHCAYVLSHSNLNILNYEKGFGDHGISAGKQMQSLGAGKPMVCNIPVLFDDIINDHNLGVCDMLDTPQKYADAILKIYHLPQAEYDAMCERVKEVAQRFDYKALSQHLIEVMDRL